MSDGGLSAGAKLFAMPSALAAAPEDGEVLGWGEVFPAAEAGAGQPRPGWASGSEGEAPQHMTLEFAADSIPIEAPAAAPSGEGVPAWGGSAGTVAVAVDARSGPGVHGLWRGEEEAAAQEEEQQQQQPGLTQEYDPSAVVTRGEQRRLLAG